MNNCLITNKALYVYACKNFLLIVGNKLHLRGIFFFIILCLFSEAYGQQDSLLINDSTRMEMRNSVGPVLNPRIPNIIPISPELKAITRYGDYPVDYRTGMVDISVPIYEIKTKENNMPIDIRFHASGRMANEVNGVMGIRWTFGGMGVVTRTLKGRPDEWEYLTSYDVNPNIRPSFEDLYNSCVGDYRYQLKNTKYDSEYDVFNFYLPNGKHGKFILKKENGVKRPMLIPYQALKVEPVYNPNNYGYIKAFRVLDIDGREYYFDGASLSEGGEFHTVIDNPHEGMYGSIPVGWYLKHIVSANKTDTIEYVYQKFKGYSSEFMEIISTGDRLRDYSISANFHPNDLFGPALIDMLYMGYVEESFPSKYDVMFVPVLSSIMFKSGKIDFKLRDIGNNERFWMK